MINIGRARLVLDGNQQYESYVAGHKAAGQVLIYQAE